MISKILNQALARQIILQARNGSRNTIQVRTLFPRSQTKIYTKPQQKLSVAEELFWAAFFVGTMISVPLWVITTHGSISGDS